MQKCEVIRICSDRKQGKFNVQGNVDSLSELFINNYSIRKLKMIFQTKVKNFKVSVGSWLPLNVKFAILLVTAILKT